MTIPPFTLVFPGDPDTITGGFIYDRKIRDQLTARGVDVRTLVLDGPFPSLDPDIAATSIGALSNSTASMPLVIDGLALGGFGDAVAPLTATHPLIGLVHHPLALETGLSPDEARRYADAERAALSHCCGVIASSETTRETLIADFNVKSGHCIAVPPGIAPFPHSSPKSASSAPMQLLSVGTLTPRKGYPDLIAALAQLAHLSWRLDILGDDALDPGHALVIGRLIDEAGLSDRIILHGKSPRVALDAFYAQADIFVLAALYEGYGIAFAEAVAAGLPVIGTTGGAIPRTVPNGCGIIVESGDVSALKGAVETMITRPEQRTAMAAASRAAAKRFEDWPVRAAAFADAVGQFAAGWQGAY